MKKITLLMGLILFCSMQIVSAQKLITGKVTDAKDGSALPGVSITIKGTTTGTLTDPAGNYSIKVPDNQTLKFSFMGYDVQEIIVGNKTSIDVTLVMASNQLDEVVVVGYGTERKINLTSSISSIPKAELNLGGTTINAAQAVQGRAAGVSVTQGSFAPGDQPIIRVRGANSIKSTNEPLYVVDGFPSSS